MIKIILTSLFLINSSFCFISLKDGKIGLNVGGFHTEVGLGGTSGGVGLQASAGTPFGQEIGAGIGTGSIDGRSGGGAYVGASSSAGVGASAAVGGALGGTKIQSTNNLGIDAGASVSGSLGGYGGVRGGGSSGLGAATQTGLGGGGGSTLVGHGASSSQYQSSLGSTGGSSIGGYGGALGSSSFGTLAQTGLGAGGSKTEIGSSHIGYGGGSGTGGSSLFDYGGGDTQLQSTLGVSGGSSGGYGTYTGSGTMVHSAAGNVQGGGATQHEIKKTAEQHLQGLFGSVNEEDVNQLNQQQIGYGSFSTGHQQEYLQSGGNSNVDQYGNQLVQHKQATSQQMTVNNGYGQHDKLEHFTHFVEDEFTFPDGDEDHDKFDYNKNGSYNYQISSGTIQNQNKEQVNGQSGSYISQNIDDNGQSFGHGFTNNQSKHSNDSYNNDSLQNNYSHGYGYDHHGHGYGQHEHGHGNHGHGYGNHEHGYGHHEHGYGHHGHGYDHHGHGHHELGHHEHGHHENGHHEHGHHENGHHENGHHEHGHHENGHHEHGHYGHDHDHHEHGHGHHGHGHGYGHGHQKHTQGQFEGFGYSDSMYEEHGYIDVEKNKSKETQYKQDNDYNEYGTGEYISLVGGVSGNKVQNIGYESSTGSSVSTGYHTHEGVATNLNSGSLQIAGSHTTGGKVSTDGNYLTSASGGFGSAQSVGAIGLNSESGSTTSGSATGTQITSNGIKQSETEPHGFVSDYVVKGGSTNSGNVVDAHYYEKAGGNDKSGPTSSTTAYENIKQSGQVDASGHSITTTTHVTETHGSSAIPSGEFNIGSDYGSYSSGKVDTTKGSKGTSGTITSYAIESHGTGTSMPNIQVTSGAGTTTTHFTSDDNKHTGKGIVASVSGDGASGTTTITGIGSYGTGTNEKTKQDHTTTTTYITETHGSVAVPNSEFVIGNINGGNIGTTTTSDGTTGIHTTYTTEVHTTGGPKVQVSSGTGSVIAVNGHGVSGAATITGAGSHGSGTHENIKHGQSTTTAYVTETHGVAAVPNGEFIIGTIGGEKVGTTTASHSTSEKTTTYNTVSHTSGGPIMQLTSSSADKLAAVNGGYGSTTTFVTETHGSLSAPNGEFITGNIDGTHTGGKLVTNKGTQGVGGVTTTYSTETHGSGVLIPNAHKSSEAGYGKGETTTTTTTHVTKTSNENKQTGVGGLVTGIYETSKPNDKLVSAHGGYTTTTTHVTDTHGVAAVPNGEFIIGTIGDKKVGTTTATHSTSEKTTTYNTVSHTSGGPKLQLTNADKLAAVIGGYGSTTTFVTETHGSISAPNGEFITGNIDGTHTDGKLVTNKGTQGVGGVTTTYSTETHGSGVVIPNAHKSSEAGYGKGETTTTTTTHVTKTSNENKQTGVGGLVTGIYETSKPNDKLVSAHGGYTTTTTHVTDTHGSATAPNDEFIIGNLVGKYNQSKLETATSHGASGVTTIYATETHGGSGTVPIVHVTSNSDGKGTHGLSGTTTTTTTTHVTKATSENKQGGSGAYATGNYETIKEDDKLTSGFGGHIKNNTYTIETHAAPNAEFIIGNLGQTHSDGKLVTASGTSAYGVGGVTTTIYTTENHAKDVQLSSGSAVTAGLGTSGTITKPTAHITNTTGGGKQPGAGGYVISTNENINQGEKFQPGYSGHSTTTTYVTETHGSSTVPNDEYIISNFDGKHNDGKLGTGAGVHGTSGVTTIYTSETHDNTGTIPNTHVTSGSGGHGTSLSNGEYIIGNLQGSYTGGKLETGTGGGITTYITEAHGIDTSNPNVQVTVGSLPYEGHGINGSKTTTTTTTYVAKTSSDNKQIGTGLYGAETFDNFKKNDKLGSGGYSSTTTYVTETHGSSAIPNGEFIIGNLDGIYTDGKLSGVQGVSGGTTTYVTGIHGGGTSVPNVQVIYGPSGGHEAKVTTTHVINTADTNKQTVLGSYGGGGAIASVGGGYGANGSTKPTGSGSYGTGDILETIKQSDKLVPGYGSHSATYVTETHGSGAAPNGEFIIGSIGNTDALGVTGSYDNIHETSELNKHIVTSQKYESHSSNYDSGHSFNSVNQVGIPAFETINNDNLSYKKNGGNLNFQDFLLNNFNDNVGPSTISQSHSGGSTNYVVKTSGNTGYGPKKHTY